MDYFLLLLRIIHIVGGIFWVGGTLIMTFFIAPTMGATAEAGQRFVGHLMNNLKFSNRMSIAAGLTILAGAILYWRDSHGLTSTWMKSGAGIGFTTGAVFALIGFATGIMIGRTTTAMAQLGAQFRGKPTSAQMTQMQAIQKQQRTYSMISVVALLLAVTFMAVSRYLNFG
ncbi:MAG TPA: hypothetical protein VK206_27675 [Anaerolineales bacterium]|nr:hypothetical protein [Anaerolineales bacterium]